MSNADDFKKYTSQAQRGIRGEAFFESLMSAHSLPNQIAGPKDVGIDYICQWVYKNRPTNILYAVQVKTFSVSTAKPKYKRIRKRFNALPEYEIRNSNFSIEQKTLCYWQTLSMPVYLFAICDEGPKLSAYYKRFTPHLTKDDILASDIDFFSEFYKVSVDNSLRAFADPDRKTGGFARDLFIDYIRCNYCKGSIIYLNPRTIGLSQFPDRESAIFVDLFGIYEAKILKTYRQTSEFLSRTGKH